MRVPKHALLERCRLCQPGAAVEYGLSSQCLPLSLWICLRLSGDGTSWSFLMQELLQFGRSWRTCLESIVALVVKNVLSHYFRHWSVGCWKNKGNRVCLRDYSGEKGQVINGNLQGCLDEGRLWLLSFFCPAHQMSICTNTVCLRWLVFGNCGYGCSFQEQKFLFLVQSQMSPARLLRYVEAVINL